MKRPRPATFALVIIVALLGVLGFGLWRVSLPPSLGWTAEEIAAEQRALVEASMPPGEAAWPLIEEALAQTDVIVNAWPEGMMGRLTNVSEPLLRLGWEDPRLAPGKTAFVELAPVVGLLLEASKRPRLFEDGAGAGRAGAWMETETGPFRMPAVRMRTSVEILLVDARRALAEGDAVGFVQRIAAAARLADLADQAPLLLTISSSSLMRSLTLDAITDAFRDYELSSETCDALFSIALAIRDGLLEPDVLRFKGERLFSYAELLRIVERSESQGVIERLLVSARVRASDSDELDYLDDYDAAWLDWMSSRSTEEVRAALDAYEATMGEWWSLSFMHRPAEPPGDLGFPDVGLLDGAKIVAMLRGRLDLVRMRAVGVAALAAVEGHRVRTGSWPESLLEVTATGGLSNHYSGIGLGYSNAPSEGWPITLRLTIGDGAMARLQPPYSPFDADDAFPDERLVTRPAQTMSDEELAYYSWLAPEEAEGE